MRVVIQRVRKASISVDQKILGEIQIGLLVLLGIDKNDNEANADKLIQKILNYRIFVDNKGKMNLSVSDIKGGILLVSQFTLSADTNKGLRPSFSSAASPEKAKVLYQYFVQKIRQHYSIIETGIFGADMQISLINDGPVTFVLDT